MKKFACILFTLAVLAGCASGPQNYGDSMRGYGNLKPKLDLILGYASSVKPIENVGIVVLDSILYVQEFSNLDGTKLSTRKYSLGNWISTSNRTQIHLDPGRYMLKVCFTRNAGAYAVQTCQSPIEELVTITKGQIKQLSLIDGKRRNTWGIIQTDGESSRVQILKDFNNILESNKLAVQ